MENVDRTAVGAQRRFAHSRPPEPQFAMALIGREAELEAIQAMLRAAGHGPAGLVLDGEPGMGKTALWEHAVALAKHGFSRVLAHRSVAAEARYAFSGLADLVTPVVDEVAATMAPPRRRALEVALLLRDPPDGEPPDALAIGLALHDALGALAASGPVLVALDDVQWLDPSSAAVLQVALRRLADERVAVLATHRAGTGKSPLDDAIPGGRSRLAALAEDDIDRLLRAGLDLSLSGPELARVEEVSGGNPYFALELGRELVRLGIHPEPGRPLPVPATLRELLGRRFDALDRATLEVLLDAATLARPTLDLLSASRSPEVARAAIARALDAGVVEVSGHEVRFAHPLLASIAYERATPWEREDAHRRLADVVTDPEERARHLALADDRPDEDLAMELERAAARAAARGAVAAAVDLAELSVLRTPTEAADVRLRRLSAAAGYHHRAGALERAGEIYEDLRARLPAGPQRAEVVLALAVVGRYDVPTRIAMCEEVLPEAGDGHAAALLSYIAMSYWSQGEVDVALHRSREALRRAEAHGSPRGIAAAIARVGMMETFAVDVTPGLLERGVVVEEELDEDLPFIESPRYFTVQRLIHRDRLDEAEQLCRDIQRRARDRGDEHSRHFSMLHSLVIAWQAGRLREAMELGNHCRRFAHTSRDPQFAILASRFWIGVNADLGHLDEARVEAMENLRLAEAIGARLNAWTFEGILGRIDLLRGDVHAAAERLRELPAQELRMGFRAPTVGSWPDAIEALIAVGDLDRARTYSEQLTDVAARTSRWARVGAARCRGLLTAAEGDVAAAETAFADALAEDQPRTYPLERGRTLLALGTVRRRARQHRAARDALREAIVIFEEIGAEPWAAKARAELGRVSGRRAPEGDLTPAERRVAALAAAGRQNKEIAAELYVGVGTVEAHLSRIYRKLNVRSRTELASRLAGEERA